MTRLRTFYIILLLITIGCKNKTAQMQNSGYAPVNGIKMYYEIHGEGKPLVLIHGGGSTITTSFGTILPMLAKHRKIIAVELQAHGHTADRDTPESFEQDANDVAALLNYLKIDKADVLGFSNGGHTTMQLGISHPQKVNKLVIISAFYKREGAIEGFFDGMNHATLDNMPAYLKEAYLQVNNDSVALRRMFERDRDRMQQFKGWSDEEIASIKAPSLIIIGTDDIVTKAHAAEMKKRIANSELLVSLGNHGSFIGEGLSANQDSKIPAQVVGIIEKFLDK
jgi:pimeloyl-ACP methyl ester carboxylesterase